MNRRPVLSFVLILALLPLCGCSDARDGAGDASVAAGHGSAAAPAQQPSPAAVASVPLVQEHARGVFFDRRAVAAATPPTAAVSTRPDPARLQRTTIADTASGQPVAAMMIDVPAGWNARGGVEWDRQVECAGNAYQFRWSAASPDGLYEVTLLPRLTWQVESAGIVPFNPCPAAAMGTARDYLQTMMRNTRPQARVVNYRERPDLVAALSAGASGNTQLRIEAGELLIGYALAGREMRETLIAAVTFSTVQGSVVAWADAGFAYRAPDGELDFALAEKLRTSARLERPWAEQMLAWSNQRVTEVAQRQSQSIAEWHQRRMNEITTAGMMARSQIRQETIAEIGRIHQRGVASRDASNTRQHEQFKDYVQEVQPWRDPSTGGQVDLSIHYNHAWQLDDGRQFLTNDPSFDPNRDLGIGGHALQPVR